MSLDSVHLWTQEEVQRVRNHYLLAAGSYALAAEQAKGARDAALRTVAHIDYVLANPQGEVH